MYSAKPSHAHRWLNCTTAPRLSEEAGGDTPSDSANEGLVAHEYAAVILRQGLGELTDGKAEAEKQRIMKSEAWNDAMHVQVPKYTDLVMDKVADLRRVCDPKVDIEGRVYCRTILPGQHGYIDASIVTDQALYIYDLKYGRGDVWFEQLKIYAAEACAGLANSRDIRFVYLALVQPLLNRVHTLTLTRDELMEWAHQYAKPRAAMARSGGHYTKPGAWCKYCPAAATCSVRADAALEEYRNAFPVMKPEIMPLADVSRIVASVEIFESWLKDARKYLAAELTAGATAPHHKMVKGRASRRITDEAAVKRSLRELGFKRGQYIESNLVGITKLENLLGVDALAEHLGPYIQRKDAGPVLAGIDDKRDSYEADKALIAYDAFADLAEE